MYVGRDEVGLKLFVQVVEEVANVKGWITSHLNHNPEICTKMPQMPLDIRLALLVQGMLSCQYQDI